MHIISFPDRVVRPAEWVLLIACYLVPVVNLLFLPVIWFLYPLFALLIFLFNPRSYLVRFHFLQSFFCFLGFTTLVIFGVVFSAISGNSAPAILIASIIFWIVALGYPLLTLCLLVLLCLRRSLSLPLAGSLAQRLASRHGRHAQERSQGDKE